MDLPVPIGHVLANKYRVERFIGAGGMGMVAAGTHLELDHSVAIKFLCVNSQLSGEGAERFRREARAAAKIHSEHVVRVFDVGLLDEAVPYMVMELLEGNDFDQEVEARGPLPLSEAAGYVLQAIDAIAEAHAAGIVHRDLKPSNLYLAKRADGMRVVKVLDFGISKSVVGGRPSEVALTKTSSLVGSPLFMSPEQMRSAKDVDARSDLWALGAILYYLVTGREPFAGETLPQLCLAVINEPHTPTRNVIPGLPDALDTVISRCLAKDRADRFASLAEFAEELVQFAPGFRAHADRAARLLSKVPRESHPVPATPRDPSPSQFGAAATQRTSQSPVVDARAGLQPSATHLGWDKTSGKPTGKRRGPLIALSALALLVVAVAGVFVSRSGTRLEGVSAPSSSPKDAAPRSTAPSELHTVAAAKPAAEPAAVASTVAPIPTASAVAGEPVSAPAASVSVGLRGVPPRHGVVAPPAPRPAPLSRQPLKGSADVTYFGGRR